MTNRLMMVAAATSFALALGAAGGAPASELVVNGDFSGGNTGFTSGYTLTTMTPDLFQNAVHGIYAVEAISAIPGSAAYGDWDNVTTSPSGGPGFAFVSDGPDNPTTAGLAAWSETVKVKPNATYTFSFYGAEISNACCSNAQLQPSVNGDTGTTASQIGSWRQDVMTWNSGSNTTATLEIKDLNDSGGFNDFVMTDISFRGAAVPEPAAWTTLLLGLAALGAALRASRRNAPLCVDG
jgi:hypothetical protein